MKQKTFTFDQNVEIKVTYDSGVKKETSYCDGSNIAIDKKYETVEIVVFKNKKIVFTGNKIDTIIDGFTPQAAIDAGCTHFISDGQKPMYLTKDKGPMIYDFVQSLKDDQVQKIIDPVEKHRCPICGGFCYGDCESE